jgi:uncharacterized pyridoxal phosphate-containing UPF0001 family protein
MMGREPAFVVGKSADGMDVILVSKSRQPESIQRLAPLSIRHFGNDHFSKMGERY